MSPRSTSTTLTYWHKRLAASARPHRITEAVFELIEATGVLAGKRSHALALLGAVDPKDLDGRAHESYALLALIAGQDAEPAERTDGTDGRWRIARCLARDRIISVVDPEAPHAHESRAALRY